MPPDVPASAVGCTVGITDQLLLGAFNSVVVTVEMQFPSDWQSEPYGQQLPPSSVGHRYCRDWGHWRPQQPTSVELPAGGGCPTKGSVEYGSAGTVRVHWYDWLLHCESLRQLEPSGQQRDSPVRLT